MVALSMPRGPSSLSNGFLNKKGVELVTKEIIAIILVLILLLFYFIYFGPKPIVDLITKIFDAFSSLIPK